MKSYIIFLIVYVCLCAFLSTVFDIQSSNHVVVFGNDRLLLLISPSFVKRMNSGEILYEAVPASEEAYLKVLQFAYEHYKGVEPQEVYLGIGKEDVPRWNAEVHEDVFTGLCCWAKDANSGEIVGLSINGVSSMGSTSEEVTLKYYLDEGYPFNQAAAQYIDAYVANAYKLMTTYNVSRMFYIGYLVVHSGHSRRGIGVQLVDYSMKHAQENGFEFGYIVGSSHFTQRICEKLSFECVQMKNFVDITIDGKQVISNPNGLHLCTKAFLKKLC